MKTKKAPVKRAIVVAPYDDNRELLYGMNNKPIKSPYLKESDKLIEPIGYVEHTTDDGMPLERGIKRLCQKTEQLRKALVNNKIAYSWIVEWELFEVTAILKSKKRGSNATIEHTMYVGVQDNEFIKMTIEDRVVKTAQTIREFIPYLQNLKKWK